jgi:hypothetical protein
MASTQRTRVSPHSLPSGIDRPTRLVRSLLLAVPLFTFNCQQGALPGGLAGAEKLACPQSLEAIANTSFGLEAALDAKIKAGLSGALYLQQAAAKVEATVATACANIASDLGADVSKLPSHDGTGSAADQACSLAAAEISKVKASYKASIAVESRPPVCEASLEASAHCAAECDASVDPGAVKATCEGGQLSGACEAECKGECTVEGNVECKGECSGSCTGECKAGFSGTCGGQCDGSCDGKQMKGKCKGTCDGSCSAKAEGSCTGKCEGKCEGACSADVSGKCGGECSGECSVEMKAPKCTGKVTPPEASVECKAKCDAKATAELECTPPQVSLNMKAEADVEQLNKLRATLSKNLPLLLASAKGGVSAFAEDATASIKSSLEGLQGVVSATGGAAVQAGACLAAALKTQASASASISVSVKASASASGSVSAGS